MKKKQIYSRTFFTDYRITHYIHFPIYLYNVRKYLLFGHVMLTYNNVEIFLHFVVHYQQIPISQNQNVM